MKKTSYFLSLIIAISCLAFSASADVHMLEGCNFLFTKDYENYGNRWNPKHSPALLLNAENEVIHSSERVYKYCHYINGCIVVQYTPYLNDFDIENLKYGAIDLDGNLIVQGLNSVDKVLKSKKVKKYIPSADIKDRLQKYEYMQQAKSHIDHITSSRKARMTNTREYITGKEKHSLGNETYTPQFLDLRFAKDDKTYLAKYEDKQIITDSRYNILYSTSNRILEAHSSLTYDPALLVAVEMLNNSNKYNVCNFAGDTIYSGYFANVPQKLCSYNGSLTYSFYSNNELKSCYLTTGGHKCKPDFKDFFTHFIEINMEWWYQKDEFETINEYDNRISKNISKHAIAHFAREALRNYISFYGNPFQLGDYNKEHETFLLISEIGDIPIKVPYTEAMKFRKAWPDNFAITGAYFSSDSENVTLKNLKYNLLTSNDYSTELTGEYYFADNSFGYVSYDVDYKNSNQSICVNTANYENKKISKSIRPSSDVDCNITSSGIINENTIALVIANENYKRISNVSYANFDGLTIGEYFNKVIGIKSENVSCCYDATRGDIIAELDKLKYICKSRKKMGKNTSVLVYYAGHGAQDDTQPFIVPIDAREVNTKYCIPLQEFYDELGNLDANYVTVFMDACFTGKNRDIKNSDIAMTGSRSIIEVDGKNVSVKAKNELVIFSASKGTALPYEDKEHGLFTYYLLSALRRGIVNYGELYNFLYERITEQAIKFDKNQEPSIQYFGSKYSNVNDAMKWFNL